MPDAPPNAELMRTLGRLVRGLSTLFWGLPLALVVCFHTARTDWLRPLGFVPPVVATGLLLYGLWHVGQFQKQERVWQRALDRAKLAALVNFGLSPFLCWWNKFPLNEFFVTMVALLGFSALVFLDYLNVVLLRLSAMLPDETLRQEARQFTPLNRILLLLALVLAVLHLSLQRLAHHILLAGHLLTFLDRAGIWLVILLVLLPLAMTMALLWKTKEVIFDSVFGARP
ncbi:MAG TPA: hypothetical protein VI136_14180 [Verrucomicrobiae bacterium]